MITILIIFLAILLSGFAFWFYNRKQITSLSETIEDKNTVINALKNHVEETETTPVFNPNDEWRGTEQKRPATLTPTVDEVFAQKKKKKNNYYKKKSSNVVKENETPNKQKKTTNPNKTKKA
jgi:hypothetical protein